MLQGKRIRVVTGAAVAVALGVLAGGFFLIRGHPASARAATVPATVTINANFEETFAPAPSSATPALTAEQAWQQHAEQLGSSVTTIPPSVTAQLGLFTLENGPADNPDAAGLPVSNGTAYSALNQLAYGYSWHSCPPATGLPSLNGSGGSVTPPPNPCVEWLFLDANTGQMIVDTWQM